MGGLTFFDNSDFKVRMNGKEYLDYKKYRDKLPTVFSKKQVQGLIILAITLGLAVIAFTTIDKYFTPDPAPINYGSSIIYGLVIPNMLIYFMIASIGIAWIFHGFGFIIIRR